MVLMCSVPLCKSVSSKQHNVKLHKFAASEELKRKWLDSIKLYYPNFKISKFSLVCSKHFAEIDFIKTTRSKSFSLRKDAVPSLFDVEECVYVFNDIYGDPNISSLSTVDVMEVEPTYSFCKDAVPTLFDDEECVYVFNDSELDGDSNIPSTSIIDVMETSKGVTTSPKMSNNSNISGPS
ncbi:uncharacterized protein LOC100569807 [Acyrthosiphon pisum]|uniref:THAP-type domain-containing protein n=1 Tax=Acyrthosiphon pisum TaxID=7029 RepID=A0A8R2AE18_ACYPI|nr:uncharacterized protein LOC100569807 [Acyrthosiphon pisum]|eukprot:XP_003244651.1 PREDICTED: uncharacterized protein LOC100569807 [Acyrthosiphon pisum]